MQMRSNAEGDLLHFKYYDASEDAILDIIETYEFIINDILGVDSIFLLLLLMLLHLVMDSIQFILKNSCY